MEQENVKIKQLIFNPFIKLAGLPALAFGVFFLIVGALLAGYCNARFDGVIDLHFGHSVGFVQPLIDQVLAWGSLVLVFYLLSLAFGARPRLIDLAGTMALARLPFAFAPMINAGGHISNVSDKLKSIDPQHVVFPVSGSELIIFVLLSIISVILLVWLSALYFNAYKICTNLKGNNLIVSFIVGLLMAEALSVYLIRTVFNGI